MADITLDPYVPSSPASDAPTKPRRARRAALAGAFVVGGLLGSTVTAGLTTSGTDAEAPTTTIVTRVAERPADVPLTGPDAHAAARKAEAERRARICRRIPPSAEAVERCPSPGTKGRAGRRYE